MYVDNLQSLDCGRAAVTLQKSLVRLLLCSLGNFAPRPLGQGTIVGYCCGSLVFANLCSSQSYNINMCDGFMEATTKTSLISATKNFERVEDRSIVEHYLCVVPVLFCAMRYLNDGRYFPAYEAPKLEQVRNVHKKDCRFFTSDVLQMDQLTFCLTKFWPFELYETSMLAKSCTSKNIISTALIPD